MNTAGISLFIVIYLSSQAAADLLFVQAIWRHGDRAPTGHPYPNDPYTEDYWPRGWSQLTNIGMRQHHNLGQEFRNRYANFISPRFKPDEVKMRSSNVDRALTSAQAFLFGFYPATGENQFVPGLEWQPIPIHSYTDGVPDPVCHPASVMCAKFQKVMESVNKNLSSQFEQQYSTLFKSLEPVTGFKTFGYDEVNKIYDITRELDNNMTDLQPPWVQKVWPEYGGQTTLELATELRRQKFMATFDTVDKYRYWIGVLLDEWLTTVERVRNGTQTSPSKMALYSSHDTTLMPLLFSLGVSNNIMIPYAAAVIMEVHSPDQGQGGDPTIQLFYHNATNEFHQLEMPACSTSCTISRLLSAFDHLRIPDLEHLEAKCSLQKDHQETNTSPSPFSFFMSLLLIYFMN